MGFLDSIQSSINRGAAAANRTATTMQLKTQMNEALKRRQSLAAQLGASLYEATRNDPALRAGREALYDGIAQCDTERAQCQAQIDQIEQASQAAAAAASYYVCPFCGSHVGAADMFCSGCGKPMDQIKAALAAQNPAAGGAAPGAVMGAAPAGPTCPQCGAPIHAGDAFCMSCGAHLDDGDAPAA